MKNQRSSRQRQLILEAVKKRHDHPTADQIYLDVRSEDSHISRGTVYRNLALLSASGQISNVKVPAADRFDFRPDRHYHLFCTGCGRVFDAPISYHDEYDALVAEETGFQISRHRTVFEGLCPDCSSKMKEN